MTKPTRSSTSVRPVAAPALAAITGGLSPQPLPPVHGGPDDTI